MEELGREGVGIMEMEGAEEGEGERQEMVIMGETIEMMDPPRILMEMEGEEGEETDFHREEALEEALEEVFEEAFEGEEEVIEEDNVEEEEAETREIRIAGDSFSRLPIGRNRNSMEETKTILTLPKTILTLPKTTQTLPKIRLEGGKPTSRAMKCGREATKI